MTFELLHHLHVPAPEFECSLCYYTEVLGGSLVWKIHVFGVRLAYIISSAIPSAQRFECVFLCYAALFPAVN